MNPFVRQPSAYQRTPIRAESPAPKAGEAGAVSLRLYDPIDSWGGPWGISAKEFAATLDELPDGTTHIQLLINSPGGEVWEGLAILNALRAHPAEVTAVVEGIAASSASFIAAGVDNLLVMQNAELFVHRAWGLALGNAEDMTKLSADLAHEDRNIASIYAAKAGGTVEDWLAAMSAETFYSAEEAVAAGLANAVLEPKNGGGGAAQAKARFDLRPLAHSVGSRDRLLGDHPQTPAASASGFTHKEGSAPVPFTDEHLATMRTKLGLAADADEDSIVASVAEVMDEFTKDPTAEPVKAALPEGTVAVDQAMLEQLRADAAAGRQAREQQQSERCNALVQAAVGDGRIAPASRGKWLNALKTDPDGEVNLASLAPGLIPFAETGHDALPAASSDLGWFDTVTTTSREG